MKGFVFVGLVGIVLSSSAWAGGDKSATAFVDSSSIAGGSNGFTNGLSSGTSKTGGCTTQIGIKGLSGINAGDQVICIGSADVMATALPPSGAGNSAVWVVPALAGAIKVKSSLAIVDVGGIHCGSAVTTTINANTECYKPDPSYVPATACAAAGMLWVAAPMNTAGLAGVCQGLALGARITAPLSGKIAQTGMTIPIGAK